MQETPPLSDHALPATAARREGRFIYVAAPWTPVGGGMYKVTDYLVQSQADERHDGWAQLRPLDSRGARSAAWSMWVLLTALAKILRGRLGGRLAGVHVNVGERLSLVRKGTIVAWSHLLGLPVVLHLHAQMQRFYRSLPRPLRALTRQVFALAEAVIVIGPAARRFVIDELGVPAERVSIVINGVPSACVPRRARSPGQAQQVVFLGNLGPRKGVDDLLQALARPGFDRARLAVTIAGGGAVQAYREQARQLGLAGFVQLPGWCDQQRTAQLLAGADVLVLPSHDEVLPLVILEALANGVAVVCTGIGEIPSLLTDRVDALYVRPGDVDQLAATLQQVLGDAQLRETLEHNGHALYRRQFSLPKFFTRVARVHRRAFGIAARHRDAAGPEGAP